MHYCNQLLVHNSKRMTVVDIRCYNSKHLVWTIQLQTRSQRSSEAGEEREEYECDENNLNLIV